MVSTSLAGCSILVVEDEPLIALDIAHTFEDVGAQVVAVTSLRSALVAVEKGGLSAAILDHALGDGDSSRLYGRLNERSIPFVIYSGYAEIGGLGPLGVHLAKPASPDVLVSTVERLLRSPASEGLRSWQG